MKIEIQAISNTGIDGYLNSLSTINEIDKLISKKRGLKKYCKTFTFITFEISNSSLINNLKRQLTDYNVKITIM